LRHHCQRWLYVSEHNHADGILTTAISANKAALVQPPSRRFLTASSVGARRILTAKWFVPGGFDVASGGGSSSEEDL
jgi:hypothetical protein